MLLTVTKHLNKQGGCICEIDTSSGKQYVFADIGLGLGHRQSIQNAKWVYMNEMMEHLVELQTVLNTGPNEFQDKPCSSFVCMPGCSCGTWGREPYVQEENYMDVPEDKEEFQ